MLKKGENDMSSEEMREDLESFVNEGIKEGRNGWPVKGRSSDVDEYPLEHGGEDGEIQPFDFMQERPLLVETRLDRLFRRRFQNMDRLS